jgi:hypothetical protein
VPAVIRFIKFDMNQGPRPSVLEDAERDGLEVTHLEIVAGTSIVFAVLQTPRQICAPIARIWRLTARDDSGAALFDRTVVATRADLPVHQRAMLMEYPYADVTVTAEEIPE